MLVKHIVVNSDGKIAGMMILAFENAFSEVVNDQTKVDHKTPDSVWAHISTHNVYYVKLHLGRPEPVSSLHIAHTQTPRSQCRIKTKPHAGVASLDQSVIIISCPAIPPWSDSDGLT
jgi:uncharacterized protein YfaP (DUF2135 family)